MRDLKFKFGLTKKKSIKNREKFASSAEFSSGEKENLNNDDISWIYVAKIRINIKHY